MLDAERPWWVLDFYEVGLILRLRPYPSALGAAILQAHRRFGGLPPGRFHYRTEPFRPKAAT
jgi:hypothetical protein